MRQTPEPGPTNVVPVLSVMFEGETLQAAVEAVAAWAEANDYGLMAVLNYGAMSGDGPFPFAVVQAIVDPDFSGNPERADRLLRRFLPGRSDA